MNILVPGGAGYLGAMLVPKLLSKGHFVTVLDPQWFGPGYLPEDNEHLKVVKGDIRADETLNAAIEDQDVVICLASISAERMCQKYTALAQAVNVDGLASVAVAARNAGVKRFIYASSVAVYGNKEWAVETDELQPTTKYGEGKLYGERHVREILPRAVIVRCASICGYSPHMRFDLTVNSMVHDAIRKGEIIVNGGDQTRCHIDIVDAMDFYGLLIEAKDQDVAGQTFNIITDNQKVINTAWIVIGALRDRYIALNVKPRTDDRSYSVCGDKARKYLGFMPKRSIHESVVDMKAHFDLGSWKDSLTNLAYQSYADGLA